MKQTRVLCRAFSVLILFSLLLLSPAGIAAQKKTCSHQWQLVNSSDPTCTRPGKQVYQCSLCGTKKTEKVKALGHDWSMCMITRKPTCTQDGIKHCVCSRNQKHVMDEKIPALGHSWGGWVRTVNPSAETPGSEMRRCSRCKATEKRKLPKLDPSPEGAWTLADSQSVSDRMSEQFLALSENSGGIDWRLISLLASRNTDGGTEHCCLALAQAEDPEGWYYALVWLNEDSEGRFTLLRTSRLTLDEANMN